MAIVNPHVISNPIVSRTGTLTAASQVQLNDDSSAESAITAIRQSGFVWLYDSGTAADPPDNSFRFDNATLGSITNIYLDKTGETARIDEYLTQFVTGSYVWVQKAEDPSFNVLFETRAAVGDTGGATGYFTIPVTFQRSVGSLSATNGDRFNFHFLEVSATAGAVTTEQVEDIVANLIVAGTGITEVYDDAAGSLTLSLPNNFLAELTETDTNTFTNRVDVTADAQFVRFWLRDNLVTVTNVDTLGEGLAISEANGVLPQNGPTFQQTTDDQNAYVYVTLPDAFVSGQNLNNIYLVVKSGTDIVSSAQFGTSFVYQSDIDGDVSGRPYRSNANLNGGSRLHYIANQTLELFFVTVDMFFEVPLANVDNVDLTRAIKNLPETALDSDTQAKLNYIHGIPDDDQFKLDQFVETSTTSSPQGLVSDDDVYYKLGSFSNDVSDYYTTDFNTGLPPSFDQSTTWTLVAPHNYDITSLVGVESGTGTSTLVKDDVTLNGVSGTFNVYRATVPPTASATNFFQFFGTVNSITEIDPTSLIKIDRTNVQPDFLTHIENSQGTGTESERLTALENKVSILYPLATNVDTLDEWADIYIPERVSQTVVITDGYDLIADFRGAGTRYESTGVVYDDSGVNIIEYTGLSDSLQRSFGFRVTGPADQTLLSVVDGTEIIPFVDVTAAGNYRINHYTPTHTADQPVPQYTTFLSAVGGDNLISTTSGDNSIFIIPDYPAGATDTSRQLTVGFDVLSNGVDTQGEHFVSIEVPETNVAQDRIQVTFTAQLGPLHNNRSVTATIDYRFTVPSDYRIIFTMISGPSDVTLRVQDVALTRSYTAAASVARVDDFQIIGDLSGDYTFTGQNELLITFQPHPASNSMNVVPVAVDSTGTIDQLNDISTPVPHTGFSTVRIPEVATLSQFKTFRADHILNHSDLASDLRDRDVQWAYGKARLRESAPIHAVNEAIDLASGSTLNGSPISTGGGGTLAPNVLHQATAVGTGAGELVSSIQLPTDYANYDFVYVVEVITGVPNEWRNSTISTHMLNSGDVAANDEVRIQGNSDFDWTSGTRTLSVIGGSQSVYRVVLYDL